MLKHFKVYDAGTGKIVVSGTAQKCREKLGVTDRLFRAAATRGHRICNGKYVVVDCGNPGETTQNDQYMEAIESWDRFVEPLRKLYGIPVYKAPKEDRR
jgi:hypothetical protein